MQIPLWAWIVFALLFIFGLCWITKRCDSDSSKEHFFGANSTLTISWQPLEGYQNPVGYNYAVNYGVTTQPPTTAGAGGWGAIGTNLPSGGSPASTSAIVSPALCPDGLSGMDAGPGQCDFGESITFAVQSVDQVTGATSSWALTTINLTSETSDPTLVFTDANGQALVTGSTDFMVAANIDPDSAPLPLSMFAYVYVQYFYQGVPQGGWASNAIPVCAGGWCTVPTPAVAVGSFVDPNDWPSAPGNPTNPGPLTDGQVIYAYFLAYDQNSDVYFYGSTSVSVSSATPSAPSGVTWSIST